LEKIGFFHIIRLIFILLFDTFWHTNNIINSIKVKKQLRIDHKVENIGQTLGIKKTNNNKENNVVSNDLNNKKFNNKLKLKQSNTLNTLSSVTIKAKLGQTTSKDYVIDLAGDKDVFFGKYIFLIN